MVLLAVLPSCEDQEEVERRAEKERMVALVQEVIVKIRRELNDPDSAIFESVTISPLTRSGVAVCGSVNAKNRMGGYAGFRDFFYTRQDGLAIEPEELPLPRNLASTDMDELSRYDEEF